MQSDDPSDPRLGTYFESFYLVPETSPGSGIYSNYIPQVDSDECPIIHPYPYISSILIIQSDLERTPYARIGNGVSVDILFVETFFGVCDTPSLGGFQAAWLYQTTKKFAVQISIIC